MAKFLANRDGGSLNEQGIYQHVDKLFSGEVITGFQVTQQASPTIGIKVNLDSAGAASAMIPSGDLYPYMVFMDAAENITLATADGSNPRIDLIVAYVDVSVVDDTNPNNPGAFLIDNVTGTPSGSPAVPNNAAIQAVIGASNPYIILARVAVAAGATTITNANVTDVRSLVQSPSSNPYKFSVRRVAAATTGNNAFAKVVWDTEDFDTNGNFATGTYTAPTDGFYQFSAYINVISGSVNIISLYKNGSEFRRGDQANHAAGLGLSVELQLVAGNTIDIYAFGNAANSLDVTAGLNYFTGFRISQT